MKGSTSSSNPSSELPGCAGTSTDVSKYGIIVDSFGGQEFDTDGSWEEPGARKACSSTYRNRAVQDMSFFVLLKRARIGCSTKKEMPKIRNTAQHTTAVFIAGGSNDDGIAAVALACMRSCTRQDWRGKVAGIATSGPAHCSLVK